MTTPFLCTLALAGTLLAGTSNAAEVDARQPPVSQDADLRSAIESISHGRATVSKVFQGPGNLTGIVTASGAGHPRQEIVWSTQDRSVFIVGGTLLSRNGVDLTKRAEYSVGMLTKPGAAVDLLKSQPERSITVGHAGPMLTAFVDPNCIYCNMLYLALRPYTEKGLIRVRYVLVGTLKDTSLPRAAAIMAAADPARAWAVNESSFDRAHEEGGWAVPTTSDPTRLASVEQNNDLFRQVGAVGTPALLYCGRTLHQYVFTQGVPADVAALLDGISSHECSDSTKAG